MTAKLATALAVLLSTSTLAMANDITFDMSYSARITGVRTIQQTGTGNTLNADLTGSLNTVTIKQTGSSNIFNINNAGSMATSVALASLSVEAIGSTNIVDSNVAAFTFGFPDEMNSFVKITGSTNSVDDTIDADVVKVETYVIGSGNELTSTLAAPSVELSMDIIGHDNTVTQTADATALVYVRRAINGSRNTIEYNPTTDTNVVNLAATVRSTVNLTSSDTGVTLRQRGAVGTIDATLNMEDRLAVITQTGANNTAYLTVVAAGDAAGTLSVPRVDYTLTQSAGASTVNDLVFLASGAYSSINVTN